MDLTLQRGAIPVTLDRERLLFFDHAATWLLIQKYGAKFALSLYRTKGAGADLELELASMEALAFFLFAGLQADAKKHGETLTPEQAAGYLHPWNYYDIFRRVVYAVVGNTATPAMLGKSQADGAAAKTPAEPSTPAARHAASKKKPQRTTSTKRSGSRSPSSGGPQKRSGKSASGK